MKLFQILLGGLLIVSGCSKDISEKTERNHIPGSAPQVVKDNKSIVKVEILSITKDDNGSFAFKAKALEVKADPGYANIAVINQVYDLKPNYSIDPLGNKLNNEKNKSLALLDKLKRGDKIILEIAYTEKEGWLINKVLQQE